MLLLASLKHAAQAMSAKTLSTHGALETLCQLRKQTWYIHSLMTLVTTCYINMERKYCLKSRQRSVSCIWKIQTKWPRKSIIEAQQGNAFVKAISKCNANHPFSCSLLPIQVKLSNDDVIGIEARHWRKRITSLGLRLSESYLCLMQFTDWNLLPAGTRHKSQRAIRYKHIIIQNTQTQHNILVYKKKTPKNIPKHDTRLHKSPKTQCKKQQSTVESQENRSDAAKFPISLGFTTRAGRRAIALTLTWILAFLNL